MNLRLANTVALTMICAIFMVNNETHANELAHTQYNSGLAYYNGDNSTRDYNRAHRLFRSSADLGYGPAQYQMGLLYSRGHGIDQDYPQALQWFHLAANQRVPGAHHQIGRFHHYGHGVPRNSNQAILWYSRSFEAGYQESLDPLAQLYLSNQSSALTDLSKLLQGNAESGDSTSQYNLGYSYYIGHNVEKDHSKAALWFLKAAVQGDSDSQTMLAKMYDLGEGVSANPYQCYLWASVATSRGNEAATPHRETCQNKLAEGEQQRATEHSETLLAGFIDE